MASIGIVGQGFVGNAIKEGFKDHFKVLTYDKYVSEKSNSTLEEIVENCSIIFSCVPTPMDMETGEASIKNVIEVIDNINNISKYLNKRPTVIVKSTIPVGTTSFLDDIIGTNIDVIFSPEFLTEANAVEDFKNQNRIVLGVNRNSYDGKLPQYVKNVKTMFNEVFMDKAEIVVTGAPIAEMVKYVTNTFLATKVSYANEIYQIAENAHIDYNEVIRIATLDKRLGDSHWKVPGPDGDFGFGGHCFPKDLQALRYMASQQPVKTRVLDAVLFKNNEVRSDRDWEKQEGRAVINGVIENQGRSLEKVQKNEKILGYVIITALLASISFLITKILLNLLN